jgi:ABC-type sugar transport system permease subunit
MSAPAPGKEADPGTAPPSFRDRVAAKRERRRRILMQKWGPGYLLVTPAIVLILAMMVYPVIQTALFSLSRVQLPTFRTTFVALDNFVSVFTDPATGPLVQRTIIWVVATVALRFVLGFLAALVFNAKVKGTVWMRVLVVLPWTIPSVVAANLWRWILQADTGVLNQTLRSWGLPEAAANWLGDPHNALFSVIVAYSWAGFPFVMLLILAGMQGIPEELYEAAKMDGANWWQLFWYITVPSLRPVLIVALVLETVSGINSFDTIMVMTGGGPAGATEIWGIEIYRTGFGDFNLGVASAMSMLLFATAFAFFVVYGIVNKGVQKQKGSLR